MKTDKQRLLGIFLVVLRNFVSFFFLNVLIWLFRKTEFDGFPSNILGQSAKQEGLVHPPMLFKQFYHQITATEYIQTQTCEMKTNMLEKKKKKSNPQINQAKTKAQ